MTKSLSNRKTAGTLSPFLPGQAQPSASTHHVGCILKMEFTLRVENRRLKESVEAPNGRVMSLVLLRVQGTEANRQANFADGKLHTL